MKLVILMICLALALASPYDLRNHQCGHELEVSLRMNPNTVFVILWYSSKADPKVIDSNNGNRTEIASRIVGKDNVVFSAIDMGIDEHVNGEHHNSDYSVLYNIVNGKKWSEDLDSVLKTGPIVNVIRKSKGVKITGKGIPDETNDQVDGHLA